jgi:WD domain, G-beta repeat/Pentapeptide repeats (8 copies)
VRHRETEFRFAHTSLQEFFLAGYLHRALVEGGLEDWALPRPSRETLDFLGQLLLGEGEDNPAVRTLRAMRDAYRPQVSELAFAYVLLAQEKGYPAPSPAGFQLSCADLRQWRITGRGDGPVLNLRGASFRGARMMGSFPSNLDLENVNFSEADLVRAVLTDSRVRNATLSGTDLRGALFRNVALEGTKFTGALLHRTQFLRCRLTGAQNLDAPPPAALFALCDPAARNTSIPEDTSRLAVFNGHSGSVSACTFAPDGMRLATDSRDNTLRLWDPVSRECLAVLRGHEGGVESCAFAPDGTRLASASLDHTLRLWDPVSGECLTVLRGHENSVSGCAFAPDGKRLASASWTARCGCGTRLRVNAWRYCADTITGSWAAPSHPMERAWPPPPWTTRCGCGTRLRANAWRYCTDMKAVSRAAPSRPMERA